MFADISETCWVNILVYLEKNAEIRYSVLKMLRVGTPLYLFPPFISFLFLFPLLFLSSPICFFLLSSLFSHFFFFPFSLYLLILFFFFFFFNFFLSLCVLVFYFVSFLSLSFLFFSLSPSSFSSSSSVFPFFPLF